MFDTYKLMSKINTEGLKGMSYNDVALRFNYKCISNKEKDKCFAYLFVELFPMLLTLYRKRRFYMINEQTRVELILESMFKSLTNYDGSKKVKFTSFLFGNIERLLINKQVTSTQRNTKRAWFYRVAQSDLGHELTFANLVDDEHITELNKFLTDLANSSILNPQEQRYCMGLLMGYKRGREIVDYMGIETLHKYNEDTNTFKSYKGSEHQIKKYINELRLNIKKKIESNNYSAL